MRPLLALLAICAVAFGGAFAVGSVTRGPAAPAAPAAAKQAPPTSTPSPVVSLAPADRLPGLRAAAATARQTRATSAGRTVAVAAAPRAQTAPVAQTPRATTPVATSKPAPSGGGGPQGSHPTTAASGPSATFFDEGD